MKLDLTSLYFNGETESLGNTSSWGTALGQERPNYPISVEGGQEIVDQIKLQLPVWKHQYFADGTDEWVNCA
jgi:molybdopterin synthase catalytic subunit